MADRGFILQPTYRIESGRPVVHLFGVLENGESFLVRDDTQVPRFFVRSVDEERAKSLGAASIAATQLRSLDGFPVSRIDLQVPQDAPPLRKRLIREGIPCYEGDVRFAMRFLIDRSIRGTLSIDGPWQSQGGLQRVYHNPRLAPEEWTPRLSVLSFDIETDRRAETLFSIALHGAGVSEVLFFDPGGKGDLAGARTFPSQKELLEAFARRVREIDPDVITGWNVVDFDFKVLERLAKDRRMALELGRTSQPLRLRPSRSPWSSYEAVVPGRVVVDGIHLLRGSFLKMESYTLEFAARKILGTGKTIQGRDRAARIEEQFHSDPESLVEYNLTDARLVLEILDELNLIEIAVERSKLTGLPIDRIAGSIAAFDFLYLSHLHKRGIVAPTVGSSDTASESPGGHVLDPEPGLYENVYIFDFKSLYPSLIRTFQIDPLGYVPRPDPCHDLIVAPNGASFRREPGILTLVLDELFPRREAAKAAGDEVTSYAIKILMNSFYGVLGTPACRFSRPELASAITGFGREILLWTKKRLEFHGFRVLYGDTDSLFVPSELASEEEATEKAGRLVTLLNRELADWIRETWGVEGRLELEFETFYRKLHLPSMRHGGGGARKRYVGLVGEGADSRVVFTGMEVVRRDWTELAKEVQRQLYRRLFDGVDLTNYLDAAVADLRAGRLDGDLVYHKALRKKLEDYTATTPPHVAAARKMSRPGRLISYLMTVSGPEPADERVNAIDYEHYVRKQVRPVAQPILDLVGEKFERVIGDDRQMELF